MSWAKIVMKLVDAGRLALLMFLSLGMPQTTGLIGVQGQTCFPFARSQMIAHQAGILGKIDAVQRQLLQMFLAFLFPLLTAADATVSKFATHATLTIDAARNGEFQKEAAGPNSSMLCQRWWMQHFLTVWPLWTKRMSC
jgi:hypothetical protein